MRLATPLLQRRLAKGLQWNAALETSEYCPSTLASAEKMVQELFVISFFVTALESRNKDRMVSLVRNVWSLLQSVVITFFFLRVASVDLTGAFLKREPEVLST